VVLPKGRRGRPSLRRLLLGPRTVVNLSLLKATDHRTCRSLVYLGLIMDGDLS